MANAKLISKSSPELNRVETGDKPVHDWYRFVLSYPPHLVREYLARFGVTENHTVLDPFCGTGTTLVECKKRGISSIGIEANPMAHFACRTKVDWSVSPLSLKKEAAKLADSVNRELAAVGISDEPELPLLQLPKAKRTNNKISNYRELPLEQEKLILTNSISPLPLHKTLLLRDAILQSAPTKLRTHFLLALAKTTVFTSSNLHFGPEVGVGPPKSDAVVIGTWLEEVGSIARDIQLWKEHQKTASLAHHADARDVSHLLGENSIDAVITSPPYPNEKDYTRTTRLESVLLGFLTDKESLRALKKGMLRSNTRGVYKGDDDDRWVADHAEVQRIAAEIENRRIELGKTSGFERMYHRVTKLYFGGMKRHFHELRNVLRPGAKLAYVVGDQASYLRVMIRTGTILADLAESLGYRVVGIDLFRTRLATATREQLREEVVVLEWPGKNNDNNIRLPLRSMP